jgi:hypothetical protein
MGRISEPTRKKTILRATGQPVNLAGDSRVDGAGCWLHFDYLASKLRLPESGSDWQPFLFAAIPEPRNPFDPNAVALSLDNHHVGYLPASEAKVYAPVLAAYVANGFVPFIRGMLRGQPRDANDYHPKPWTYVYVSLFVENVYPPQRIEVATLPGALELANDGAHLLDDDVIGYRGLSGESEHDALQALIDDAEGEYALARLVLLPPASPGKRRRVGVQWRGRTVARLSTVSSGRYIDAMECAERKDQLLAARIRVPRWQRRRETLVVMVFIDRDFSLTRDGRVAADENFISPKAPAHHRVDIGVDGYGPSPVTVSFETSHPASG